MIVFFMALYVNSTAQSTKDLHPIEIKKGIFGNKYFYNDQSFQSPYALQIPLMQVNDSQVTRDFMVFEKSRNTAKIVNLISSGILIYTFFNREKMSDGTYLAALGTVGAVSAFFNIRSGIHLDKAIGRYNKIVSGAELGVQYDKTYNGNGILSVGIYHKFK
jgi:hypothetical protein